VTSVADLRERLAAAEAADKAERKAERARLLDAVSDACAFNAGARRALVDAMRAARKGGVALRPISEASGYSPEWTRRLTSPAWLSPVRRESLGHDNAA
jgi:hypothetical protein